MSKEEQKKQQHPGGHPDKGPKEGQKKGGGGGEGRGGGGGQGKKPQPKKQEAPAEEVPQGPKVPPRLRVLYHEAVRSRITEKFGITNVNAMPKLDKIVLNVNMGRHLDGSKLPPTIRAQVLDTLVKVSGQRPVVIKAKKSVS